MTEPARPNILVIWGDDIGTSNLSAYSDGLMGYRTPNIDRIADEGLRFTDAYGEQSCTAGRSAFITGQSVYRTGLSKVGPPRRRHRPAGRGPHDRGAAQAAGVRHRPVRQEPPGDRDEFLPTAHGFDEFFGNLYHLNAEEEPEHPDYPPADEYPQFRERFGPRGVIHSVAEPDGTQRIEDTGPLTRKRMQTIDDEAFGRAADFIRRQHDAGVPFFVWFNSTHMHFRTHARPESRGQAGRWQSEYHDVMIDHDALVGRLLDLLDELGLTDDTIVVYSTDNGPHANTWPDAATTPFRSEKNTNWEGAFRVPQMIRWPARIPAGVVSNAIISHLDWLPTLLSAAGEPDIGAKLLEGHDTGTATFRVHLDGHDFLPHLTGEAEDGPRIAYFYFSDDGDLMALRYDNWKFVFLEQRRAGTLGVWAEPFTVLRVPKLFNLRTDPFERADTTSNTYWDWLHRPRLPRRARPGGASPSSSGPSSTSRRARRRRASPSTR